MRYFCLETRNIVNSRNATEFRIERLRSGGIDLFLVHATGIKIANLLLVRTRARLGISRRAFEDPAKFVAVSFGQFVEPSPTRVGRRDRILLQPFPVREIKKIITGFAGLVENRQFNTVSFGGLWGAATSLPGPQHSNGTNADEGHDGSDQYVCAARTLRFMRGANRPFEIKRERHGILPSFWLALNALTTSMTVIALC